MRDYERACEIVGVRYGCQKSKFNDTAIQWLSEHGGMSLLARSGHWKVTPLDYYAPEVGVCDNITDALVAAALAMEGDSDGNS